MADRKMIIWANLGILFIAVCWGLNFSVITWALSDITPMYYLALRFLLSGGLLGIIFIKTFRKVKKEDLVCGIFSGMLLAISFAAQTIGLQYTTPGKAGFLANACVVIMPFLVWMIYRKKPAINVLVGAGIAFFGLAVMSLTERFTLQSGDLLELLCALSFAGQTLVIDRYAEKIDPVRMAVFQVLTAGILSLAVAALTEPVPSLAEGGFSAVIAVGYGVIFCTAVSFVIQGYAQRIAQPAHVSIILCFEAVFAFLFALLFGYESLTVKSAAGSVIVMIGFIISQIKKKPKKE